MKYYEFDYKNEFQKAYWHLEIPCIGIVYSLLGFLLSELLSDYLSVIGFIICIVTFCVIGVITTIYNSVKIKGVFLFEDYIEISSVYTKKTIIQLNEITEIIELEKHGIPRTTSYKGGYWNNNCIRINYRNIGTVVFNIKNQDDFLEELKNKVDKTQVKIRELNDD